MNETLLGSVELGKRANDALRAHLGVLYQYFEQPDVQEVMINSPSSIWLERNGQSEKLPVTVDAQSLESAITVLANLNQKGTTPILDARLPGLRIAATLPPVSPTPSMSIRRHSARVFQLVEYETSGSFDPFLAPRVRSVCTPRPSDAEVAAGKHGVHAFLRWVIESRSNFVLSGSTSSGKTSLLNAMAEAIPHDERVLVIEDTSELRIQAPNHVCFEANTARGITIRDLVRHALRYRPNRILIGEIRGAEAFDMLDAYNTGHPGSAVSFHSDSPELSLARLENMIRMAPEAANWPLDDLRRQIAATFRFVIHCTSFEGKRGPTEIMELLGAEKGGYRTKTLFRRRLEEQSALS